MKYTTLSIILLIFQLNLFATAQVSDKLIIGYDTMQIDWFPLEEYLKLKPEREISSIKLTEISTACYRGYQATWRISNDSLFLVKINNNVHKKPNYISLRNEFNRDSIFFKWFTGKIKLCVGKVLNKYMIGQLCEKEIAIDIENGKIISRSEEVFLEYDSTRIPPYYRLLRDTLMKIIVNQFDSKLIAVTNEKESCTFSISFNKKGEVDTITCDENSKMSKKLYEIAVNAMNKNPIRIMTVKHKDYMPPTVYLFFSGHCILNPDDRKYGCVNYK